eukprot:gene7082-7295_t
MEQPLAWTTGGLLSAEGSPTRKRKATAADAAGKRGAIPAEVEFMFSDQLGVCPMLQRSWNEDDLEQVQDDWEDEEEEEEEDASDGPDTLISSAEDSEDEFDPEDCSTCEVCEGITLDSSTWKHAKRLQHEGWDICCCEEETQQYGVHAEEDDSDLEEDENEDEDNEYAVDADAHHVWGRMFGGRSYDIVVGFPRGTPTRATGSVPKALPSDTVVANGVFGRQEKDGRHCLFGAPLGNAPKLLERIFNFRRPRRDVLLWKSELPLTSFEWRYVTDALGAPRLQPLLQHGQRVKDPLPENKDCEGESLKGPFPSTKTEKPWNRGRLFFSTFKSGADSSFIWADGVKAMEPEAQQSFADEFGLF